MKRQIKESYDQIHAPITLINETKQLVHTTDTKEPAPKKRHTRVPMYLTASIAACLCILLAATGIQHLNTSSSSGSSLNDNPVNVGGPASTYAPKEFNSIKSADDWNHYLSEVKNSGKTDITLDNDYILYETPVSCQGKDCSLQIQIKQGKLTKQQEDYTLEGNYLCVIMEGNAILGSTTLETKSSSQFTGEPVTVKQEDLDHDGNMEFAMEGCSEQDGVTWYHITNEFTAEKFEN
ncbi:MAG: hypothetical protein Q4F05_09930 [bacterium]|nr:hypothetical protein [bacterium]